MMPSIGAQPLLRSEEHTSELQSQSNLVCRLLLEKKKRNTKTPPKLIFQAKSDNVCRPIHKRSMVKASFSETDALSSGASSTLVSGRCRLGALTPTDTH